MLENMLTGKGEIMLTGIGVVGAGKRYNQMWINMDQMDKTLQLCSII